MTELLMCGFSDAKTAFLARAALARLQSEVFLGTHDVAVVTWGESGEVTVQAAVTMASEATNSMSFWHLLAGFVSGPTSLMPNAEKALATELDALGVDLRSLNSRISGLRRFDSSLFVLTHDPSARDRVLGVLRGFLGEIVQISLTGPPKLAASAPVMNEQTD